MAKKPIKLETSYQDFNAYAKDYTNAELQEIRRKLAKRANQRMVRLERAVSNVSGEAYSSYGAYQVFAKDYLRGKRRFSEKIDTGQGRRALQREITVLQGFLNAKSSTVQGQREIEEKRNKTFESGEWGILWKTEGKRKTPLKFSGTKEFYNFLNSSQFRDIVNAGLNSERLVEMWDDLVEKYDGKEDDILGKMKEALNDFREQGSLTLKDLKKKLGLTKPLS